MEVQQIPILTRVELAERWKMCPRTLANWRSLGKGPRGVRLGRAVVYRLEDVVEYERSLFEDAS